MTSPTNLQLPRPRLSATAEIPLEIFLFHIPQQSRLLILGCGEGKETCEISQKGHRTVGVDPSEVSIYHARNTYSGLEFNTSYTSFDRESFNAIWIKNREYLNNLNEVSEKLKIQGILYISQLGALTHKQLIDAGFKIVRESTCSILCKKT